MDILRNLFGSVTSGIIRLLVTVGIIAAIGYFLVKPALDTTEKISKEANTSFEKSFGGNGAGLDDISETIDNVNARVEREINRSLHRAVKTSGHDPEKLVRCIQRAHQNVAKIQRCTQRY